MIQSLPKHLRAIWCIFTFIALISWALPVQAQTTLHTTQPSRFELRIDLSSPMLKVYQDGKLYRTFAVALGKPETQTPIGTWHIVQKAENWGKGFGTRWLGLDVSWGTYGIHGTNRLASIGHYSSHGCVRMRNGDVEQLYKMIPIGTPVIITGNPLNHIRKLEYGDIGADVQLVQKQLQRAGYLRDTCDGRFEQSTEFALIFYELTHQLPMDGEVSMEDYDAMGLIHKPTAK